MSELEKTKKEMRCSELGVHECDYVAQGESPADIVEQFVEHLRSEYGMDLPDVDEILEGRTPADRLMEGRISKDAALVVTRLREKLGIDVDTTEEPPEMPRPGVLGFRGPPGQPPLTG
jgi:predicted small metal-binding protein